MEPERLDRARTVEPIAAVPAPGRPPWAGAVLVRYPGVARCRGAMVADDAEGEAGQDRCESCQPWPVRHISIGRGCSPKKLVPENLEPD